MQRKQILTHHKAALLLAEFESLRTVTAFMWCSMADQNETIPARLWYYIYNYICYIYILQRLCQRSYLRQQCIHTIGVFPTTTWDQKCRTHHLEYLPYLLRSCLGPKFHKFHRWSNLIQSDLSQLFIHTHRIHVWYIYIYMLTFGVYWW